jgi:hypothetical protein
MQHIHKKRNLHAIMIDYNCFNFKVAFILDARKKR